MDSVESVRAWRKANLNIAARSPEPVLTPNRATDYGRVGGDDFRDMIRAHEVSVDGSELGEDHDTARTRLRISEANLSEMEEARIKGLLVEKTKVDMAFFEAARGLRDGMTNCSRRLAAEVATLSDPSACEEVVARELRHLLESFVSQLAQKAGTPTEVG